MDRAAGLAAKLEEKFSAETELIKSSGGAFEIIVDGKLVYSKIETRQFPIEEQLLGQLGKL